MADDRGFEPSGFFVLRSPLLPYASFLELGDALTAAACADDGAALEQALAADRALVRTRLRALIRRSVVRDALFLASPSLEARLDVWVSNPDSEAGRKVERALMRYVQRMAVRPTPFGLFAGCSTGLLAEETSLRTEGASELRRYTRLDMHYLCALAEDLAALSELRPSLRWFPNSSLCGLPLRPRYIEGTINGSDRNRTYHLIGLAATEYLQQTLARARDGSTIDELAAALTSSDVSLADALAYVEGLVDSQVLVPSLEPFVTGPEPLSALISALSTPAAAPIASRLAKVRDELQAIDQAGPGALPATYRRVAEGLAALPTAVELPRLYQVDLLRPAPSATLGRDVIAKLSRAVGLLARLAPSSPREGALRAFRESFRQRYEDREMPLMEVLDDDVGIGFGSLSELGTEISPLLDGLDFPIDVAVPARWGGREEILLRKLQAVHAARAKVLELTEADLDELASGEDARLPDAFAAVVTLGTDRTLLLHAVAGPSGALLFGRFCHGDPSLLAHVRAHLAAEERLRPDAVFAEIAHLPQGRSGNILCRPLLRQYELPYSGRSGAAKDHQLRAADLLVSVRGERVLLRSRSLDKEIVPRLTTAHNFVDADVTLYRFLCALQTQDGTGLNWDWGSLSKASFLPRVVAGDVVLALAAWRLWESDLKPLLQADATAWFRWAQDLRTRLQLPRFILFADFDNRLPVDLDNVLSVEAFCQLIKERKEALLLETYPGAVVEAPEGLLTHELIVPFVCTRTSAPAARVRSSAGEVKRSFAPGSEWLYLKIYTGVSAADDVLRLVAPVLAAAVQSRLVERWFFLRYSDPDYHLRLRAAGPPERLLQALLPALTTALEPLKTDGRIWRMALDTYQPEVERYGGDRGLVLAERLFHADSEAALEIVCSLSGEGAVDSRWQLCVLGVEGLLDAFALDDDARRHLLHALRTQFAAEFRSTVAFERQLDKKYRADRLALETLLAGGSPGLVENCREIIRRRNHRLGVIAGELRHAEASGDLAVPVNDLIQSYIHMWTNRMFRSAGRAQELVIYDFLSRVYESRLARRRQQRPHGKKE